MAELVLEVEGFFNTEVAEGTEWKKIRRRKEKSDEDTGSDFAGSADEVGGAVSD